jgi:ABC-type glycerol-3-phosphate transport system substrate-binding protein
MKDGSYKDVMKDIEKFNKRHPYVTITTETIQKSIMTKSKVSARMQNGVTISPKLKAEIDAHVRNYWGGSN